MSADFSKFHPNEISHRHKEMNIHKTETVFQVISGFTPEICVLILSHNSIQTLIICTPLHGVFA